MACLHPLVAIRAPDGSVLVKKRADVISPWQAWVDKETGELFEPFDVPCGKCMQCRLDYARKWANRCMLESQCWQDNWFLTLTYDDDNLPPGKGDLPSLKSNDFRDFMKRLREYYDRLYAHQNIRFFACGEYGDNTARPHYHMIAFNLPLGDLVLYSRSPLGDCYYNSATLSKLWGKGHVVVGELTEQSAAYVARYCQKKVKNNVDYNALGIQKEFVRMSRRPGIGAMYLEVHLNEIYQDDKIYLPQGKFVTPFRYFDDKAAKLGIDLDRVKSQRRSVAAGRQEYLLKEVGQDYDQYLEDLERSLESRAKSLRRNL